MVLRRIGLLRRVLPLTVLGISLANYAWATTPDDAVMAVALSHQTQESILNGRLSQVVYVGQTGDCSAVSIRSPEGHDQHFRVCKRQIIPRATVAPSWPDNPANTATLTTVVKNAVLYGQASQTDEDGYLIQAKTLGAMTTTCKHIEVIISFEADLVDYALKKVCD
ncbi:hypothetical protein QR66_00390 [Chromobacterium piscinae]|nr:hypothetical protein QR66_00390 [Chromobacterium piscinae]